MYQLNQILVLLLATHVARMHDRVDHLCSSVRAAIKTVSMPCCLMS